MLTFCKKGKVVHLSRKRPIPELFMSCIHWLLFPTSKNKTLQWCIFSVAFWAPSLLNHIFRRETTLTVSVSCSELLSYFWNVFGSLVSWAYLNYDSTLNKLPYLIWGLIYYLESAEACICTMMCKRCYLSSCPISVLSFTSFLGASYHFSYYELVLRGPNCTPCCEWVPWSC